MIGTVISSISVNRYTDGSGGCDGCLNWEGVGFVFDDAPGQRKYPDVGPTNNNGLECTVYFLEQIYIDRNYPAVGLLENSLIISTIKYILL